MKPIIIVCGAPRSRTTFLFRCLLSHPNIKGAIDGEYHTNENPLVMFDAIERKDYSGLEMLLKHWCVGPDDVLAVKAPGYVLASDYFENNPFGLKPIFLVSYRTVENIIISNVNYPDAVAHVSRPLAQTDCPKDQQARFASVWSGADIWGRCYMRALWHLEAIQSLSALLVAPTDYRRPQALAARLCAAFDVPDASSFTEELSKFQTPVYDQDSLNRATAAITLITHQLAGV
jgi:hypothetical protein